MVPVGEGDDASTGEDDDAWIGVGDGANWSG